MKTALLYSFFAALLAYLMVAFILMEIDLQKWPAIARGFYLILTVVIVLNYLPNQRT